MRQNLVRLMMLSILILLCIWQTITLWLGNMSGHNFFADSVANYEMSYVNPKQMWSNVSGNIYKLESNSEKEKLLNELVTELRKDHLNINLDPKESYTKVLLQTRGIIYEMGTSLSLDEIIGQSLKVHNSKYTPIDIKEIYVDLSTNYKYKTYIYLIDYEGTIKQKITLDTPLNLAIEVSDLYGDVENVVSYKVYQSNLSSINNQDLFVGNVYYPQTNRIMPLVANGFKFVPMIEELEGQELENYVNALFKNPSYKTKNITADSIAFSDNLNISVKYNTVGTLEFQKTLLNDNEKLTDVERMNKINLFIEQSEAIPAFLKKGLYLEEIYFSEEDNETYYRFGYRYEKNSQTVILSDEVKKELEINSFLELGIKNSEVSSGKWIMLEPEPTGESTIIETESTEAIDQIYEKYEMQFKLENLECTYLINQIDEDADFKWVGIYMGIPIWADEKIDNE